jgi:hypothetical protein
VARAVLVSDIMIGARERIDDAGGALVEDTPLILYINQAFGKYYDVLVSADPAFFQAEATVTTVAGTRSYNLPSDWFGTMFVDRLVSGDQYLPVERLRPDQRLLFTERGEPRRYQIEAGKLALYPKPDTVYTVRHTYVPVWTAITSNGQTIEGLLGNEDLIELECAVRALSKEFDGNAPVGLVAERGAALERLQEKAFQRNVIDAQVVGMGNVDRGPWSPGYLEGDWQGRRGL